MNENGIVMSCGKGNRGVLGHGNTRLVNRKTNKMTLFILGEL